MFHGCHSEFQPLKNGTPQGRVLIPALFNDFMITIVSLQLPEGCRVISEVDDLAFIYTGRFSVRSAGYCQDLLSKEYCRIELKISAANTKAMTLRLDIQGFRLHVQGLDLEWVQVPSTGRHST